MIKVNMNFIIEDCDYSRVKKELEGWFETNSVGIVGFEIDGIKLKH